MTPRVLVIDDDQQTLDLLERVLARAGYQVATASSGEAGLAQLTPGTVDCLLVDKFLPQMNGLEVMAEARRRLPNLPIVLVTANAEPMVFGDAKPDGVLAKPFANLGIIEDTVAGVLEGKRKTLASRLTQAVVDITPLVRRRR